jgi:hypothetical protein
MAGVALSAAMLGITVGVHRRRESFRHLAAYHLQAYYLLIIKAGGPLECTDGITPSDFERIFCDRGPQECLAYRAAMYHDELCEKYLRAAEHPWCLIADDPPAPPTANPKFEADPSYYKEICGEDTDSGFK